MTRIINLPLGNKWNANVLFTPLIGTTIVCPALFPPAHLAQTSISADRISTSLPFPSSPHCEPRTTVTDQCTKISEWEVLQILKIEKLTTHVVSRWWLSGQRLLVVAMPCDRWGNRATHTEELARRFNNLEFTEKKLNTTGTYYIRLAMI